MRLPKLWRKPLERAPEVLLRQAKLLVTLGVPRAALVLYDWALNLAPADPVAIAGHAEARRLATDADTARYWRQVVGKPAVEAS